MIIQSKREREGRGRGGGINCSERGKAHVLVFWVQWLLKFVEILSYNL